MATTQGSEKTEIIYGIHPVFEAVKANRREFFKLYVAKGKRSHRLQQLLTLAKASRISIQALSAEQLKAKTRSSQHQGIGAMVGAYPFFDFADLIGHIHSSNSPPLLIVLDGVLDPRNLGAVARSALAVGADGVIIPKDRSAPPSPTASKASAGALEHIRLIQVTNLVRAIQALKDSGIWIFGLDKAAGQSLYSMELTGSVALVIGGEEKGIRPLVKKQCDEHISIPQCGTVGSLNAAAAATVAGYEVYRQRLRKFAAGVPSDD